MQIATRLALSSLALQGGAFRGMPLACHARRFAGNPKMQYGEVSLDSEEKKCMHAIGFNIGSQLGDLTGFDEPMVDCILSGIKLALMQEAPEVPLAEYVPKAGKMIQERQMKKIEAMTAAGTEALAAAAVRPHRRRTAAHAGSHTTARARRRRKARSRRTADWSCSL